MNLAVQKNHLVGKILYRNPEISNLDKKFHFYQIAKTPFILIGLKLL